MAPEQFGAIIVGTGFASSFFLHSYLQKASLEEPILVLERGFHDSHASQLENETPSRVPYQDTYINRNPEKDWQFSVGFGGSSNCWWANTPRFLPSDFELHSRYGVGVDWPVSYGELEPYYLEAERIMAISGDDGASLYPRSAPYPQPPHRFTEPDRVLAAAYPDHFIRAPSARARIATPNRPACCATGVCYLCPHDSKFTIQNEMKGVYDDPRVRLELGAVVQTVDVTGGVTTGVSYTQNGVSKTARGDIVVLGANALFNPHILLRSGFTHELLGKRLNEQVGLEVHVDLDGLDNYQGSTSGTGLGFMQYDGAHRADRAAALVLTNNSLQIDGALRMERGKWRQRLVLGLSFEDLPSDENHVAVNKDDPELPETVYKGFSEYTRRAIDALPADLPRILDPLPVESIRIGEPLKSLAHIQGTTVMGNDPASSIVDRNLVHHEIRNLLVLGSSVFPTCPPGMPTLTLSALSLWAAEHL